MIEVIKGDLLKEMSGYIVHATNCSGGFGSGFAGQVRLKYPKVYEEFKKMKTGPDTMGEIQVVPVSDTLKIINAFTQLNYGKDGKKYAEPWAIRRSLDKVFFLAELFDEEVKMPKIGTGLGGLSWENEVFPIIEELNKKYNDKLVIKIFEYTP